MHMSYTNGVGAYCRVSTLEQKRRGYGIEIQVRDITRFAEHVGISIDRFYTDEAESGVVARRRELQRLLRDCRSRRIRTVILASLDRLSRSVRLAENLFYEFEQLGVRVLIADMPNYNSEDRRDVMLRQIREVIAEETRVEIVQRLWKGRQQRVRKGLASGGNVAYGYKRQGELVVIDSQEAEIVWTILDLSERGATGTVIAKMLNAGGHRRRNGGLWTQRQVAAIASRRTAYLGVIVRYGSIEGVNRDLAISSQTILRD